MSTLCAQFFLPFYAGSLKLDMCFCHGLKMGMCFFYILIRLLFVIFFKDVDLFNAIYVYMYSTRWCIVCEIAPTVLYHSF